MTETSSALPPGSVTGWPKRWTIRRRWSSCRLVTSSSISSACFPKTVADLEALVASARKAVIVDLERHPRWVDILETLRATIDPAQDLDLLSSDRNISSELVRALLERSFQIRREDQSERPKEQQAGAAHPKQAGPTALSRLRVRPDPFHIRSVRPGDESAILDLFHRCFHPDRTLEHWRWKYEQAPAGRHRISVAVTGDGEIVANYGAYPVALWDQSSRTTIQAHQVGDVMSAAEVRGVGRGPTSLFARTARHFYAACCEGRVAFNYGVHTANSRRFSVRFVRARDVEPVAYREGQLRRAPATSSPLRRYRVERVTAPPADLDELWRRARAHYGLLIQRDRQYLAWRYFARPDRRYAVYTLRSWGRLVGWSVFVQEADRLVWGDVLILPRHLDALQHVLARASSELGGERIATWLPERPDFVAQVTQSLGLIRCEEPNDLHLTVVPFSWPDAHARLTRDLFYTWGDTDLF